MNPVIPDWNAQAVLPPVVGAPHGAQRSPYLVSLVAVVERFGGSPERRAILDGFLRYRAGLHGAGVVRGFQWLDGSFVEDVERLEGRSPNDLDVVSFFERPAGVSQRALAERAPELFATDAISAAMLKVEFRVDAYAVDLGSEPAQLVERSTYWYSMWSHRRDQRWKGFLRVDLAPVDDVAAAAMLAAGDS